MTLPIIRVNRFKTFTQNQHLRHMYSIHFTNFRRFVDFPELKFGKTTLLVGCNNAGKSTLQKAISFIISNLKGMETKWGWNCLPEFIIPESMGTYSRVNCKTTKQPMTFEISFGTCSNNSHPRFKISFELKDSFENAKKVGINTIVIEDRELAYSAEIEYSNITVKWVDYEDQSYDQIAQTSSSSIFLQEPKNLVLDQMILHWKIMIEKSERLETPFEYTEMLEDWTEGISELISLRNDRIQTCRYKNHNTFNQQVKLNTVLLPSDLELYTHPTQFLITDALYNLSRIAHINPKQRDKLSDSISARIQESQNDLCNLIANMTMAILPAHTLEKTVFYQSSHSLFPLLNKVLEASQEITIRTNHKEPSRTTIEQKILSYLNLFNLAEDFRIKSIEGIAMTCELKDKDGNWIHLCEMGSGSLRLMELFLFIACSNSNLLFIEEPEQNLHPKYQSLLADLFSMVDKQIIVETHSEYLVRRTQVIVSQMNLSEDDIDSKNPFKVYYFPEDGIPYNMSYLPSGQFEEAFGSGFFDEAGKWTRELIINSRK